MSGDFLDSNIILYSFDQDERKKRLAREIVSRAIAEKDCISFQVVQEVLSRATRGEKPLLSVAEVEVILSNVLMPLWRVWPSDSLYRKALNLKDRYGYAFYDCLIIAAALEAGCSRLLSEDLQDGQRVEGLLIENPFR